MADNDKRIDKTRPEREGPRTYIGTGVGIDPEVTKEEDDLTEKIRAVVAEMLSNISTESEGNVGEVIQNVNTLIFSSNEEIQNELTQIWNSINSIVNELTLIGIAITNIQIAITNIQGDITDIQSDITDIQSAISDLQAGSGTLIYKRISDHVDDGKYNCYLQEWVSNAWANANTDTVVVRNVMESSGHAFDDTVYFHSLGLPDGDDVVPAAPVGYAFLW